MYTGGKESRRRGVVCLDVGWFHSHFRMKLVQIREMTPPGVQRGLASYGVRIWSGSLAERLVLDQAIYPNLVYTVVGK